MTISKQLREDVIHVALRRYLKKMGWSLIAGQYPNGSDDELPPLNIMDPTLARDDSPDHRRHSKNKFVPDLVALKDRILLIIEMKPRYSQSDADKLTSLFNNRREDLITALEVLKVSRGLDILDSVEELTFVPALGFSYRKNFVEKDTQFCYFLVLDLNTVNFVPNSIITEL